VNNYFTKFKLTFIGIFIGIGISIFVFFWFISVAERTGKAINESYKKCGQVQGGKRIQTCDYDLRLPSELSIGMKKSHILNILKIHNISYHIDKNHDIDLQKKGITLELNQSNQFYKVFNHL